MHHGGLSNFTEPHNQSTFTDVGCSEPQDKVAHIVNLKGFTITVERWGICTTLHSMFYTASRLLFQDFGEGEEHEAQFSAAESKRQAFVSLESQLLFGTPPKNSANSSCRNSDLYGYVQVRER